MKGEWQGEKKEVSSGKWRVLKIQISPIFPLPSMGEGPGGGGQIEIVFLGSWRVTNVKKGVEGKKKAFVFSLGTRHSSLGTLFFHPTHCTFRRKA
jgi:hypothetical protein